MTQVYPLAAFSDNYIWIIRHGDAVAVVDPGDATPVIEHMESEKLTLDSIIITHHHPDHIGGVAPLLAHETHTPNGINVWGPSREAQSVVTHPLNDGDTIDLLGGAWTLSVLDIPGHTLGHIAYVGELDNQTWLFCGDTLFSGGCGRVFEGTMEQMHNSLQRLAALPANTQICCAHEYTASNIRFARHVLPNDSVIEAFAGTVAALRANDQPTLPATLNTELAINLFLRTEDEYVRQAIAKETGTQPEVGAATFTALRRWKDQF